MAHPVAKVFGEYHIHAQRGGGEGGVPAATGYPGLSCACMFVLMYRRPGPCLLPQSFFLPMPLLTVIYGPYGKSLWACKAQLTLVNMQ